MPPLPIVACVFATGIAVAGSTRLIPDVWVFIAVTAFCAAGVLCARTSTNWRIPTYRTVAILIAVLAVGVLRSRSSREAWSRAADLLLDDRVRSVQVTVDRFLAPGSYYTRIGARVDSVCARSCLGFNARVTLAVRDPVLVSQLVRGTRASVDVAATPLPRHRNPFTFDYGQYLRRRGFAVEFLVGDGPANSSVTVLETSSGFAQFVNAVRNKVRDNINAYIPGDDARAILSALILGDRTNIDESIKESFRQTGLMHLLAVSGLHVLIVGFTVYKLCRGVLLRMGFGWKNTERFRAGLTLLVLVGYYFVAGQSISILRALIMACIYLLQHVLQRRAQLLNGLAAAAMIILFIEPTNLGDIGFQLSFAAVASLALLNPLSNGDTIPTGIASRVTPRVRKVFRSVARSAAASFAATVGTLPILVYHFGFVSFAGVVLNVAAIPLAAGTLSSGLLCVVAAQAGLNRIATWLGSCADFLTTLLVLLTRSGHQLLDRMSIDLHWPSTLTIGLVGSILLFYTVRDLFTVRWKLAIATMFVASILYIGSTVIKRPSLDVIFFDVGQGDAALIRTPENRFMLVDTGPEPFRTGAMAELVSGALQNWHSNFLHVIVLSHPHTDHIGGTPEIIKSIRVGSIVDNGLAPTVDAHARYDSLGHSLKIDRRTVTAGDRIDLSKSVSVEVLAPDSTLIRNHDLNETSVVLRVGFGKTCLLLTGDIEKMSEQYLTRVYRQAMRCEIVKIPHHGSQTSSSPGFVSRTVIPKSSIAVASVALRNRFGLPDEEALGRWREYGASVRSTQHGAVWLRSNGLEFRQIDWQRRVEHIRP